VAQVIVCLPSKGEALSSSPTNECPPPKKKKNQKNLKSKDNQDNITFEGSLVYIVRPSLKQNKLKTSKKNNFCGRWGCRIVVEHLSRMWEALFQSLVLPRKFFFNRLSLF
jgi:hypothetical protein